CRQFLSLCFHQYSNGHGSHSGRRGAATADFLWRNGYDYDDAGVWPVDERRGPPRCSHKPAGRERARLTPWQVRARTLRGEGLGRREGSGRSGAAANDVESGEGLHALKKALRRIEPAEAFATIRPGRDGRVTARILRRGSRRLIASASASDEATLRGVLREILPNVMLDVAMKPPS